MHHAYLLIGDRTATEEHLHALLLRLGIPVQANPDYYAHESESFSVADARMIGAKALNKAFGTRKIFVLKSERYTPEAQNALLKTLEEPPADTHFFILGREESHFLPTVLSRVETVRVGDAKVSPLHKEVTKFLEAAPSKRIDFAKKFADKYERSMLTPFLDALLLELKDRGVGRDVLKKVLAAREFSSDPAVMMRLVIEHLAFAV